MGFDPRTVQPVASRYTDWVIPAHIIIIIIIIIIINMFYSLLVKNLYVQSVSTLHLSGVSYKLRIIAMFVAVVWQFFV